MAENNDSVAISSEEKKHANEESMLKSTMQNDMYINDHFSPPSPDESSPVPSENNLEKEYDFGSASSRRESDGESWETVSEEMRAEGICDEVDDEPPECPDEVMMKALSYSHRHTVRTINNTERLPENVTQIVTNDGAYIYVVGTAHFSKASQDDVEKVIKILQPDIVMVELCASRVGVLKYDEESLLKAAKEVNLAKLRYAIKEAGSVVSGVMQILLLNMSAHITKQLGMAPGGEFRVACQEARMIPGCRVVLGDRPIQATLGRAMSALSVYQKFQLGWHLLFSKDNITKEDVERYKQKDMIAEMLSEMTGDFPELSRVFVEERDQYMAQMLTHYVENVRNDLPEYIPIRKPQLEEDPDDTLDADEHSNEHSNNLVGSDHEETREDHCMITEQMHKSDYKPVIVAVVGIGHMSGIVDNIGKNVCLQELCNVPPASFASKTFKIAFKASLVAAVSWGVYSLARWVKGW